MSILEKAIGWVAPTYCIGCGAEAVALCEACATSEIISYGEHCWLCGSISSGGRTCPKCARLASPRFVWITTNYEGLAKQLVQIYKFGGLRTAADSITKLMLGTLEDFDALEQTRRLDYRVVPVPTATSRRRERGFDHAELLAKQIAGRLDIKMLPALGRLGQSRQVGAKRSIRIKQAADKYYVRLPQVVKGQNILIIDDVVTTGATLRSVTKVLRAAGAKRVDALVFAKRLQGSGSG